MQREISVKEGIYHKEGREGGIESQKEIEMYPRSDATNRRFSNFSIK